MPDDAPDIFSDEMKREALLDIMRRAIRNPAEAREVAEEIARDWFPLMKVDEKGKVSILVGRDRPRHRNG